MHSLCSHTWLVYIHPVFLDSIPQLYLRDLAGVSARLLLPHGCAFWGDATLRTPGPAPHPCLDAQSLTILPQVHPEQEKPEPTPLVELEELSGSELTVFITPPEEPPMPEGSEPSPQYW